MAFGAGLERDMYGPFRVAGLVMGAPGAPPLPEGDLLAERVGGIALERFARAGEGRVTPPVAGPVAVVPPTPQRAPRGFRAVQEFNHAQGVWEPIRFVPLEGGGGGVAPPAMGLGAGRALFANQI